MATFDYPTSPYAIVVPVLACITIFIDIPPFIWHVKNRNLAAAGLVFWIVMTLFFDFINALIWPTDDIASWWKGFVLCDIEVKLLIASTIGVPGSLACIMKNLASVLDTNSTVLMPSSGQRRRQLAVDFCLTFGLPIVITLIHYVVQPSRYYIYAIAGCLASFDDSWPTVLLVWMWPSLISLLGVYYSGMSRLIH